MKPKKFILTDPTFKDILIECFGKIYLSLIPFTAGIFFAFYQNPLWLLFLLFPLITGDNFFKKTIKKYL